MQVDRYTTDIAPSASRGKLASIPRFLCATGVCAGYFTCRAAVRLDDSGQWRVLFVVQSVLAVLLAGLCAYLPDSPRWLLGKGRREMALRALECLGIEREEAEKDILAMGRCRGMWRGFLGGF